MRISDWSSDVCSSDLHHGDGLGDGVGVRTDAAAGDRHGGELEARPQLREVRLRGASLVGLVAPGQAVAPAEIGEAEVDVLRLQHRQGLANEALALDVRSEEHTSELQSLMRISYAVFCLQKKNQ